jgi:transcriptional antiterminator RfaH
MNLACPKVSLAGEGQPELGLPGARARVEVCKLHPRCDRPSDVPAPLAKGDSEAGTLCVEEDLLPTATCPCGLSWFVAHTRPRCEKKLAQNCARDGLQTTLPCYTSVHRYRGKTVAFDKPLFPGYVFLFMEPRHRQQVLQNQYVANLLVVTDQVLFVRQLGDVMCALEAGVELRLVPQIGPGRSVRIKAGPLGGLEGWVEARHGMSVVLLRLDFIGQAAAVKVHADELELI